MCMHTCYSTVKVHTHWQRHAIHIGLPRRHACPHYHLMHKAHRLWRVARIHPNHHQLVDPLRLSASPGGMAMMTPTLRAFLKLRNKSRMNRIYGVLSMN